jgi:hypothetical protein
MDRGRRGGNNFLRTQRVEEKKSFVVIIVQYSRVLGTTHKTEKRSEQGARGE